MNESRYHSWNSLLFTKEENNPEQLNLYCFLFLLPRFVWKCPVLFFLFAGASGVRVPPERELAAVQAGVAEPESEWELVQQVGRVAAPLFLPVGMSVVTTPTLAVKKELVFEIFSPGSSGALGLTVGGKSSQTSWFRAGRSFTSTRSGFSLRQQQQALMMTMTTDDDNDHHRYHAEHHADGPVWRRQRRPQGASSVTFYANRARVQWPRDVGVVAEILRKRDLLNRWRWSRPLPGAL